MLEPAADELVMEVLHCGLCHSDLSMLNNQWGMSNYHWFMTVRWWAALFASVRVLTPE
jgi:hypothetical protein